MLKLDKWMFSSKYHSDCTVYICVGEILQFSKATDKSLITIYQAEVNNLDLDVMSHSRASMLVSSRFLCMDTFGVTTLHKYPSIGQISISLHGSLLDIFLIFKIRSLLI